MADRPSERNVLMVSSGSEIRAVYHDMLLSASWAPVPAVYGREPTESTVDGAMGKTSRTRKNCMKKTSSSSRMV